MANTTASSDSVKDKKRGGVPLCVPLWVVPYSLLLGTMIGISIFLLLWSPLFNTPVDGSPHYSAPDAPLRFKMYPTTVTLEVMSRAKFDKEKLVPALAFTYVGTKSSQCRIVIPEDLSMIDVWPDAGVAKWSDLDAGVAKWSDLDAGNTIAHELSHCFLGFWHKEKR